MFFKYRNLYSFQVKKKTLREICDKTLLHESSHVPIVHCLGQEWSMQRSFRGLAMKFYLTALSEHFFLKFALRLLNFSVPLPSYCFRCQQISLPTLKGGISILACSFVIKIIISSIDCLSLLENVYCVPISSSCAVLNLVINALDFNFTQSSHTLIK